MPKFLTLLLVVGLFGLSGCGSNGTEVPALTAPGQDPPAQQQVDWQEESRKHGGGKMPAPKKETETKTE